MANKRKTQELIRVNQNSGDLIAGSWQFFGLCINKNKSLIPAEFLAAPLDFIYGEQVELLKDDPYSVRVVRYKETCIKYYKSRGPKDLLKCWLGQSKGRKSFRWALAMLDRAIVTPSPFCYLEGKKGDSFYLSHFIDFAPNIVDYLRETPLVKRSALLNPLAIFLNRMFHKKIYHLDLKGSNILITDVGLSPEFYLIDTDEISILQKHSNVLMKKCLLRITRSLADFFGRQELCTFVDVCLSGQSSLPTTNASHEIVNEALRIRSNKQSNVS